MNKQRRKEIASILADLEAIKVRIETVQSDEQEALDNLPENLQSSQKGEDMQGYIDTFDEVLGFLDDVILTLDVV
jgi:hypothetical protein